MLRTSIATPLLLAFTVSLAGPAAAQCDQVRLVADNPSQFAFYGFDLDVDFATAVVGAARGTGAQFESGAAYVYQKVGGAWGFIDRISSPDVGFTDGFGLSVAISESTIVASSWRDKSSTDSSGVVFVFEKSKGTWAQTARLTASDPAPGMYFGDDLAIDGDRLVVGASGLVNDERSGKVYVFERTAGNWSEVAGFEASDGVIGDEFGNAVDLFGDRILVGAPEAVSGGQATGAAYVFDLAGSSWTETATLHANVSAAGDRFGEACRLENKRVLAGAPGRNNEAGAAYLFHELGGNWSQVKQFAPPAPYTTEAAFGGGVDLSGDIMIIGSPLADRLIDIDRGVAHVYRGLTAGAWVLTDEIRPISTTSFFGGEVVISGNDAFISGHAENNFGGACYAVALGGDFANYGATAPNSAGAGCKLGWLGSPSIADNAFSLTVTGAPANQFGRFAYATHSTQVPFMNGFRLLNGSIFEIDTIVPIDGSGNAAMPLDFTAPPLVGGAGAVLPGTTWYFQFLYTDPAGGGTGLNLSNGVMATFCP